MTDVYSKDHSLNLFQRVDFQGIAYSDGEEIEQRILAAVSSASDRGTFSTELAAAITDWPSEYHLSRQRHCLIRPLDIRPGEKVLELGCGCGAITRFLGEIGADVTAVEGSATRARIAAERCRDLPNVKIIADDLLQFIADERFDWVLLIGVLEYAPVFSTEQQPVLHYLRNVVERMAPHGHLAVAIENKLGMKYFNGCGEDHLRVPFSGLQGLYGDRTPRTFGRGELKAELEAAGLSDVAFQYPFPDYKLPQVILTDEALGDPAFNPVDMLALIRARDYAGLPHRLFDEALVLREAAHNGLLGELSNSFLVVASRQAIQDRAGASDQTLAMSYAVQRVPEFTTQTRFARAGGTIHVHKEPLHPGLPRRRGLADGSQLENVTGDTNYVSGELAIWKLLEERAKRGDLKQIVAALEPWFAHLLKMAKVIPGRAVSSDTNRTLLSSFGLPGHAFDLTPFNLIDTGEALVPIDQEWRIDHDISMGWVVTRAVLYALIGTVGFEASAIAVVDVIRALAGRRGLDVSEADIAIWISLERALQAVVTDRQMPEIPLTQQASKVVPLYVVAAELEDSKRKLSELAAELGALNIDLAKEKAERDNVYTALHEATATLEKKEIAIRQLDAQIGGLSQTIAEFDGQIVRLSQTVAQRDEEIANLGKTIAQCDEQTAKLGQAVAERDAQIASLGQAVVDGEKKNRELMSRNTQTLFGKDYEIHTLQRELAKMLRSRSWRVTAPLRKLAAHVRYALSFGRKAGGYLSIQRRLRLSSAIRQIRASTLFDAGYYLATYPDVQGAGVDPATHYAKHGWKELRDPSAAFNTASYLAANPDVAAAGLNPLVHYLKYGQREGRSLVIGGKAADAAIDICTSSAATSLPLPDVRDCADNVALSIPNEIIPRPAVERLLDPVQIDAEIEDIRKSGLFDEAFYLSMYQDLQPGPCDPIRHYCEHGWCEGRNPSDDFDTQFYLRIYSDIRNAGLNPFWHYVRWGAAELRDALPDISPRYEDDIQFGAIETDVKLLAFYASPDWSVLRRRQPRFKGHPQPMLPNEELGQYDPLDSRILKQQAQMAKRHGVHGVCFDLSLVPDVTIETQPIGIFLAHDEIEIRFCVQFTIPLECSVKLAAESLARVCADRRQMRVEDRPVVLVRVAEDRQDASSLLAQLRRLLVKQGLRTPFVIGRWVGPGDGKAALASFCDAVLDLPSNPVPGETGLYDPVGKNGVGVVPYGAIVSNGVARIEQAQSYSVYHVVTLARDNTAHESLRPLVYTRFHIREYRRWLDAAIVHARAHHRDDRRFIFVNAWNDWNEGLYLEPDSTTGFSRLNETTRALLNLESELRMPKVSVIVPNYNHEPFLRRRLDSIYGQTYKNIEVILLDDCSSDQSRSILESYAAEHAQITRTFYNDQNSGGAFRQWAKGIKYATGDLIWIAESDDYCDERLLEVLVRCFNDEAILLAYGQSVFVDREGLPVDSNSGFEAHVRDLDGGSKWTGPYTTSAHDEVISALGIKNTIPNVSSAVFKRPINMPLLDDESWLSMRVAGDWVFYLHTLRGGRIAYRPEAINFFRRYQGSTAERTYRKEIFYREVGFASRTVAALYDVPWTILERCRDNFEVAYSWHIPTGNGEEFARWYDYGAIARARDSRSPNIMISTMGFYPGGAEILPIRLANEFKRQGHSVLFFSAGLNSRQDGVRRMLRNDVPVVETPDVVDMKKLIGEFGIEALNTHQWHMQKYPLHLPDVYDGLRAHVASLHGMIEHGDAFATTEKQLRGADHKVTTWVYTAEKNLGPFLKFGLCDESSGRFVKIPNGMRPPDVVPIPRARMNIPEEAFVLCCVSRAIPDKGWVEMIESVEIARQLSGRDIRLVLVGNGPVYDEYCRVGTPDFVHLTGFSDNSVGHYAAADMGIMLTKFKSESFPLTIVDCLFAGKPYIASDVGDIKNMLTVGDEVAGSVIELNDWEVPVERAAQEIAIFASDHQKYLNAVGLVEAAANRFRIDAVASRYVELFKAQRNNPRLGERGAIDQHHLFES